MAIRLVTIQTVMVTNPTNTNADINNIDIKDIWISMIPIVRLIILSVAGIKRFDEIKARGNAVRVNIRYCAMKLNRIFAVVIPMDFKIPISLYWVITTPEREE